MCFALRYYTSNRKVCIAVFQLKGSSLLWLKKLLLQLNMVVEYMSWEYFEEYSGRGIFQMNSLRKKLMSSTSYERVVIQCWSMR
jgi:hypothetical protein